jgi:TP901 family phage tail tape measure protein
MLRSQQENLQNMREIREAATGTNQIVKQITKTIVSMVTIYATKVIRDFWKDAVEYAKLYYDQLNEIRIVSNLTEQEADKLGESYRRLAQEMKVLSTDIVVGAVEFYRQGLPDDVVNERLKSTIQYAKISSMSFKEAAEIITAATNAMEISAERAVDVFAVLGRHNCPFAA